MQISGGELNFKENELKKTRYRIRWAAAQEGAGSPVFVS